MREGRGGGKFEKSRRGRKRIGLEKKQNKRQEHERRRKKTKFKERDGEWGREGRWSKEGEGGACVSIAVKERKI